ncbi:hypothetical protein B9Q17_06210 [Marinobacter vinifirmus]|uniref:Uncharacterized protein n=1 Tax=Marinobacter vinifirmus TaxID=355591 RepID=A0A7Z1DTD1_9GAMM|nr:hypothetical protein [Marinobacter vinifirmus]OZC34562.1 hypothetical protein B9Q17_06210 [Marinobacter vinifirmus]
MTIMETLQAEQMEKLREATGVIAKLQQEILAARGCTGRPEFLDKDLFIGGLATASELLNDQLFDLIESK